MTRIPIKGKDPINFLNIGTFVANCSTVFSIVLAAAGLAFAAAANSFAFFSPLAASGPLVAISARSIDPKAADDARSFCF